MFSRNTLSRAYSKKNSSGKILSRVPRGTLAAPMRWAVSGTSRVGLHFARTASTTAKTQHATTRTAQFRRCKYLMPAVRRAQSKWRPNRYARCFRASIERPISPASARSVAGKSDTQRLLERAGPAIATSTITRHYPHIVHPTMLP